MPQFQICSYNILSQSHIAHNLQNGIPPSHCEWITRKQKLQTFLSSKESDVLIIGLQEVETDFCEEAKIHFSKHQTFYEKHPYKTEGLMLIVQSSCIIEEYSKMILYNTQGTARRVVQVLDCLYDRTQFRVIHLHLDYDPAGKKDGFEQMKAVLRSHKLGSALPTLIVGDFNSKIGHQTTELLTNEGFLHADPSKPSCYHNGTWSRVDHIFHTSEIKIPQTSIPTVRSKSIPSSIWGSDHLPLTCEIEVLS